MTTILELGVNVWPDDLAELSARGTSEATPAMHERLKEFSAEHSFEKADTVLQYNIFGRHVHGMSLYRRFLGEQWTKSDIYGDGERDQRTYDTDALPILMFRDRMTGMVPLNELTSTKLPQFETASVRGSVAVSWRRPVRSAGRDLWISTGASWSLVDSEDGTAARDYAFSDLAQSPIFSFGLLWTPPKRKEPEPAADTERRARATGLNTAEDYRPEP